MSEEAKLVAELNMGLYGPRYCSYCQKVQPVQTYVVQGSEFQKCEGMTFTSGFTGAHVCTVCHKTIKEEEK